MLLLVRSLAAMLSLVIVFSILAALGAAGWAEAYTAVFDIWDLSVSHFSGTGRDPVYQPVFDTDGLLGLCPYYRQMEQSGLAVQATVDAWLWKLEALSIHEKYYSRNTAVVAGLEFSLFGIAGTNSDLGFIAEYQFDDRSGLRRCRKTICAGFALVVQ